MEVGSFVVRNLINGNLASRLMMVLLVVLLIGEGIAIVNVISTPTPGREVSLSTLDTLARDKRIVSATLLDQDAVVTGRYCAQPLNVGHCDAAVTEFHAAYPHSDASTESLRQELSSGGGDVGLDHQDSKSRAKFVMTVILPFLILAAFFGLIFVGKGGGSGAISDIVGFGSIGKGRNRNKLVSTGVTFKDVAGADEAVAELREVRDYLLDPGRYKVMGAQPPKGVLLLGPPGCGKTLLARAVAGESGVPFFSLSGAEFVESLVGVGAARVRDLFRRAQEVAPAIIFIDELDAAARRRGVGGGQGGSDEREQTLNQMLVAMDGFEVTSGIVVMGATNRPDILDPALLRPGRFDRHVTVDEPDVHGREEILRLHAANKPLAADIDLAEVAHRTPGFTGADLANVVNESALLAIREGHAEIQRTQVTEAIQRVIGGPRRRGRLMTDEERRRIAYHESGHALVASALGHGDQVQRLSIVARGRGLGQSVVAADADRVLMTRSELEDEMAIIMAGLAAEEVEFGEPSTTAEQDIEKVTELARQMVARYGMSGAMGPVRMVGKDSDVYLGGEGRSFTISPQTQQDMDREVRALVETSKGRAIEILKYFRKDFTKLSDHLEKVESLEGPDLAAMLVPVQPARNLVPSRPRTPRPNGVTAAAPAARARGRK